MLAQIFGQYQTLVIISAFLGGFLGWHSGWLAVFPRKSPLLSLWPVVTALIILAYLYLGGQDVIEAVVLIVHFFFVPGIFGMILRWFTTKKSQSV